MPEPNDITLLSVQKALKPKIEEVIPLLLNGDERDAALSFVAYMRANKMQPSWTAHNSWSANYKGKKICTIRLPLAHFPYKHWVICPHISRWNKMISSYDTYKDEIERDGYEAYVWDNVNICRSCANCGPGWDITVLGKDFSNICHNIPVWYKDPTDETIGFVKYILLLIQKTIAESKMK